MLDTGRSRIRPWLRSAFSQPAADLLKHFRSMLSGPPDHVSIVQQGIARPALAVPACDRDRAARSVQFDGRSQRHFVKDTRLRTVQQVRGQGRVALQQVHVLKLPVRDVVVEPFGATGNQVMQFVCLRQEPQFLVNFPQNRVQVLTGTVMTCGTYVDPPRLHLLAVSATLEQHETVAADDPQMERAMPQPTGVNLAAAEHLARALSVFIKYVQKFAVLVL